MKALDAHAYPGQADGQQGLEGKGGKLDEQAVGARIWDLPQHLWLPHKLPKGESQWILPAFSPQENHSLQSGEGEVHPAGEDGAVITLVVCHDCFFCP